MPSFIVEGPATKGKKEILVIIAQVGFVKASRLVQTASYIRVVFDSIGT